MTLKEKFLARYPRETAGARSANRSGFQRDWALFHLLALHLEPDKDYRIVFDYHDDVVVLEPADEPRVIHFYQVKTKQGGYWKSGALIGRVKSKGGLLPSILGKLFYNRGLFLEETALLNLVSNSPFDLSLADGTPCTTRIRTGLNVLSAAELKKIKEALLDELSPSVIVDAEDITFLHVTSLSLTDHSAHIRGKLQEFLDHVCPGKQLSASSLHKALAGEIERRTGHEMIPSSSDDLFKAKSLCRNEVQQMVSSVASEAHFREVWSELKTTLEREGVSPFVTPLLRDSCFGYLIDRLDRADEHLLRLQQCVLAGISLAFSGGHPPATVTAMAEQVSAHVKSQMDTMMVTDEYLKAAILVEAHDARRV